jgi:predicted TIM-barrel fold metal-dependent hydrolase
MNAIDAHLHLDPDVDGTALGAATFLNESLHESSINMGLVLHLEVQRWSPEEFASAVAKCDRLQCMINVDPSAKDANDQLSRGVEALGYIGLKLHPRLQAFSPDDPEVVALVRHAGRLGVPVLIDAFADGTALMTGFDPLKFARLASLAPETRIIWAHMGGQFVINMMMLAKRLPNVYMDCSYSLLYFRGSSIPRDMAYAMGSMRYDKVFYGSDYPDRSIQSSLQLSVETLQECGISEDNLDKILFRNASEFFEW